MKKLIALVVENPIFPQVLNLLIIVAGIACLFLIRRDVFPNASYDTISVTTIFDGASAEEVEALITNGLERRIREANGLRKLNSRSVEGRSLIVAQLDPEATTQDKALAEIRSAVDLFIPSLPEGSEKPLIVGEDSSQQPIIEVHVMGQDPLVVHAAAKHLKRDLQLLPGVARVNTIGLPEIEYLVESNAEALERNQLTLLELSTALKKRNVSVPGGVVGSLSTSVPERTVRTSGRLTGVADIEKTIVRANEAGSHLRIDDVATVTETLERPTVKLRTGGRRSVSLVVQKRDKADAVGLVASVRALCEEQKASLGEISIEYVNDLSQFITRKISILTSNFTEGLVLLVFILALFLPFRLAAIISTGLPFAIFGTLIIFYIRDYTFNLVSLIGLIIIAGMLIDDAVVIGDSCLRELKAGKKSKDAAIDGTAQVWRSVAASSFVTIIAFLPILFMGGQSGKFARQLPMGVVLALIFSLFRAFFILPGDFKSWIRPDQKDHGWKPIDRFWDGYVVPAYLAVLDLCLRHRGKLLFGAGLLFAGTLLFASRVMPFELFPSNDMEIFLINAKAPAGSSLETTGKAIREVERALAELPKEEVKQYVTTLGSQMAVGLIGRYGSELAEISVYLTPPETRKRTNEQIIEGLAKKLGKPANLPTLRFVRTGPMVSTGKPIQFNVQADEYALMLPVVQAVEARLRQVPGVREVAQSYTLGKTKFSLEVDAFSAASAGLSVEEVGNTIRAAYNGLTPTKVWRQGQETDVRVTLGDKDRSHRETLSKLKVASPSGVLIPVTKMGKIVESRELAEREHEDGFRQIVVSADVDPAVTDPLRVGTTLAPFIKELQAKYPRVAIRVGGDAADASEGITSLLVTFGMSLLGIFLLLILTYQKISHALLTFVSIPLGFMAATWAFALHGKPYTFLGVMGMIALCGVIVNHSVIFLDFIKQFRAAGDDRWESLVRTGRLRLRPIFLTTATTIAGVLPTAYGIGGADSFVTYIALALSWGLGLGTIMTLFVLPAGVAVLDDIVEFRAGGSVRSRLLARFKPRNMEARA